MPILSPLSPGDRTAELIRWAEGDHEAREALGINSWEGIEYFNKEKFEALLELWPCFALLEQALLSLDAAGGRGEPGPFGGRREADPAGSFLGLGSAQVFEMRDIALRAEERSQFKVSGLISAISE